MKDISLVCVLLLMAVIPAAAQSSAADFVGTWELVSIEERPETGEWGPFPFPAGGEPVGIIMYDELGNMAVQITSTPRGTKTPADFPEIINGYVAYYGKYEVDPTASIVTHHRRDHVNPALGTLSVKRYFSFDGDVLTLTLAPERTLRLTWARAR